ncbi:hypothetical protein DUI87_00738 [Hirundo rustica rustica]|uniref:Uncharacterized protein n=1 Tax=Hirundo rustica rustica TaxID=333673 RepID=A0A3M0LEJ9_HIRRU|nr:hypothetical protein DUI87_00738 [Hirundo rustica rustica]
MNDLGDGTEILSKSVDDRRLIKQMNVLVAQKVLKKLEKWSIRNTMKFGIGKCQVLHLGKKSPMFLYSFGIDQLKSSMAEKCPGVLVGAKFTVSRAPLLSFAMLLVAVKLCELLNWWPDRGVPRRKTVRQVNCQMRLKSTSPVSLSGKPKGTLRQPRSLSMPEEGSKRPVPRLPRGREVACGGVKPVMEGARSALPSTAGSGPPKEIPMQRHVTVVNRSEKRLTVPPRFQKELQVHLSRSSSTESSGMPIKKLFVDYSDLLGKTLGSVKANHKANVKSLETGGVSLTSPVGYESDSLNTSTAETHTVAPGSSAANVHELQNRIKELLSKYSSGVRLSKMPQIYREMYWEDLSTEVLYQLGNWPHVCTCSSSTMPALPIPPEEAAALHTSTPGVALVPPSLANTKEIIAGN